MDDGGVGGEKKRKEGVKEKKKKASERKKPLTKSIGVFLRVRQHEVNNKHIITATTILLQHFSNFTSFFNFTGFIKLMASSSSSSSSLVDPAPIVFPPPHTFDILPDLHPIVLRLLSAKNPLPGTSQSTSASFTSPSTAVTSQPNQRTAVTPSSVPPPSKATTATTLHPNLQIRGHGHEPGHGHNHSHSQALTPLDAKDLPTATSAIKTRLRGARAVVDTLPDSHRTVADQEREIAALQARIDRLTRILVEFGRRAKSERDQVQEWEINMETRP